MRIKSNLFIWIFLISGICFTQESFMPVSGVSKVDLGCSFQLWKTGYDAAVTQIGFPVQIMVFINDQMSLSIRHNPAFSEQAGRHRISSTSDTWIQGNYIFSKNRGLLNFGFGLPTGKTRLNHSETNGGEIIETEFQLSQYLSRNLYRFRLPIYGLGLCAKVGGGVALPLEDLLVFGVGIQYVHTGPYHPMIYQYTYNNKQYSIDYEYNPGDEASLNIGVDFKIKKNMKIMFDGLYTHYWEDLRDNREIFKAGHKIVFDCGYYYQFDHKYVWTHFLYRKKGKHSLWDGADFIESQEALKGAQIEIETHYKAFDFENGSVVFLGEGRYYEEVEKKGDRAVVYGGGFQTDVKIPDNVVAGFTMKYLLGYIKEGNIRSNLRGTDIFFWVKFEF